MKKLLSFYEEFDEFVYRVEDGETLADIAFKLKLPVGSIIRDNYLDDEAAAGQVLYIKKPQSVKIYLPESLSSEDEDHYPFEVVEEAT